MVTTEDARISVTLPTLSIDLFMVVVFCFNKTMSQFEGFLKIAFLMKV